MGVAIFKELRQVQELKMTSHCGSVLPGQSHALPYVEWGNSHEENAQDSGKPGRDSLYIQFACPEWGRGNTFIHSPHLVRDRKAH